MTSDLYLILHKVRGEPAFDIATRLHMHVEATPGDGVGEEVWIIPTSGHRAYPWWTMKMVDVSESIDPIVGIWGCIPEPAIPDNPEWLALPDHYPLPEPKRPQAVARRDPVPQTSDFAL